MLIKLSGDYGEGGGSIVRIALALSVLTGKPFEVDEIRKLRPSGGLKAQHLHCIKGAKDLCSAKVEGMEIGSPYLKFEPSKLISRNLSLDIGTAGAITLVLQSLLLPCSFLNKPLKIELTGGTDSKWSPSFDYMNNVLFPQIQRFAKLEARLLRRGYYPKGNGKVEVKVTPKFRLDEFSNFDDFHKNLREKSKCYDLTTQHHLIQIKGISHASESLAHAQVAERQAQSAKNALRQRYNVPVNITTEYRETSSAGSGITLWAIFSKNKEDIDENNPIRLGSDSLGEIGKKSEIVGSEAAERLVFEIESKAAVDKHLADQILPYMALTKESRIKVSEITNHCKTNIYTVQKFLGEIFEVNEKEKTIGIFSGAL